MTIKRDFSPFNFSLLHISVSLMRFYLFVYNRCPFLFAQFYTISP